MLLAEAEVGRRIPDGARWACPAPVAIRGAPAIQDLMNERSFVNLANGTAILSISKCNYSGVLQQGGRLQGPLKERLGRRFALISVGIATVWNLRWQKDMKLWRKDEESPGRVTASLRHDFVIGPLSFSDLLGRPAQLYHCVRCKWSFMVSASKVVVLDEHQQPIVGAESLRRFNSFAQGPCPALEILVSDVAAIDRAPRVAPRNGQGEAGRIAPLRIPASAARPRSGLRLLGRMRAKFVR